MPRRSAPCSRFFRDCNAPRANPQRGRGLSIKRGQTRGVAIVVADHGSHVDRGDLAILDDQAAADHRMARPGRGAENDCRYRIGEAAGIGDMIEIESKEIGAFAGRGDGSQKPVTVREALDNYKADLHARGGDAGNVARVRGHFSDHLLDKRVAALTSRELRKWRDGLVARLAPATVNRTCAALKAALNLVAADAEQRISSRQAWDTGLATIPDAEESRNVILAEEVLRRIIAQAPKQSTEFGLLVDVAAVTGARPSQIWRLKVQDLQADRSDPRLMMPTSRKGRGRKKVLQRPVPIPVGLARRLAVAAAKRPATAPLLVKPSGRPWSKSDHARPFARTVKVAGLDPDEVSIYALRHSNIVRQLLAGVPVRVVAVNHDTSIVMIERTYSRHIGDHADAIARAALLDTAEPIAGTVPSIRA
jgi:integrase